MSFFSKTFVRALSLISLAGGLIITAACSQEPENSEGAMPALTTQDQPHLGPLLLGSPMTLKTISTFFPSFEVTPGYGMTEGESYPILEVSTKAKKQLFVIETDSADPAHGVIKIGSAAIKLDNGASVGASFAELSETFAYEDCSPGEEEQSGKVFCPLRDSPTISYVFSGTYGGPDGRVPPKEALHSFTVSSIVWVRG